MNHLTYDEELARVAQSQKVKADLEQRKAEEEAEDIELPAPTNARSQLAQKFDPPEWRIEGLHIIGSNTTITAGYKTGKSTLMTNLLRSLCDGVPFLDQQVNVPAGNIAMWNLEMDANLQLDELRKMGITNLDKLYPLHLRGLRVPLYHPGVRDRVVAWLQEANVEVLIIDPAARLLPGWPGSQNPENDNGLIGEVVQKLDEVKKESGVKDLFMPIHTGRGAGGGNEAQHARGATKWDDWTDHLWQMWKKKIDGEGEIRHFRAYGRRVNFEEKLLAWDEGTGRYTIEDTLDAIKSRGRCKCLVKTLADMGGEAATAELRKQVKGFANDAFPEVVQDAVKRGWITVERVKGSNIHRLTDHEEVRKITHFEDREGIEEL